jgi:hypothetical protein
MTAAEKDQHISNLETELDRIDLIRVQLMREIVELCASIVDRISQGAVVNMDRAQSEPRAGVGAAQ